MGNPWGKPKKPLPLEEVVQIIAEAMRSHRSGPRERGNFKVKEHRKKYTMILNPCGSGGRMMRTGELDRLPPRTKAPFFFGKTKKPYFWSWGKKREFLTRLRSLLCVGNLRDRSGSVFLVELVESSPRKHLTNPVHGLFYKKPTRYALRAISSELERRRIRTNSF